MILAAHGEPVAIDGKRHVVIEARFGDRLVRLHTAPELFAPRALDRGTLAMLSCVTFTAADKVLDLGCGYGVVGIVAALMARPENVFLTDADPRAVEIARRNLDENGLGAAHVALSDGFRSFTETGFTKILSNPPFHTDFATPKHFIEKGFNRLALGGAMWMVTKREVWYRNKLRAIFGGARVHEIDGYFVFEAIKRSPNYAKRA